MLMNRQERINEVFDEWFSLEVWKNKNLDLKFTIKNDYLMQQCLKLYKEIPQAGENFHYFITEYIYHVFIELTKIEDLSDITSLSKQVHERVKFSLRNNSMDSTTKTIQINKQRAKIIFEPLSLDGLVLGEDGNSITLANILTESQSVFTQPVNQSYFNTQFKNWFNANKENILTKSQLELIEYMNKLPTDYTTQELEEITKTTSKNINNKINRIATRITEAFEEQKEKPRSEYYNYIINLVKVLNKANAIINNDEIETQNIDLFNYVAANFDLLQPLLKLPSEAHIALNRGTFNNKYIYSIASQLEALQEKYQAKLDDLDAERVQVTLNSKPSLKKETRAEIPPNTKVVYLLNTGILKPKNS